MKVTWDSTVLVVLEAPRVRPSWDEYFVKMMLVAGERGNCDRGRSGALIVVDRQIVATGYVGAPAGCKTCDEVGHLMREVTHTDGTKRQHCVRTTHAEMNAIAQAAKKGTPIDGGTIYCTMTPCLDCAKLMVNAGIKRVVALKHYHAEHDTVEIFQEAGVTLTWVSDELQTYANM